MGLRIVCVYTVEALDPSRPIPDGSCIPYGISMIATVLKNARHDVRLLVLSGHSRLQDILSKTIEEFRPHLFCMTSVATQFPLVAKIARIVRQADSESYLALGGPHASLNSDECFERSPIDAVCVGEGEKAVLELAACIEQGSRPSGIPSFQFRQGESGAIERNATRPFNEALDDLPFIDRELWRPWIPQPDCRRVIFVGRGCPHRCSYCSNHALSRLASGKYLRFRSIENVLAEVNGICENSEVQEIYLEVETIFAVPSYAFDLFGALARFNAGREKPVEFGINVALTSALMKRPQVVDELLGAMRSANVLTVNVGLESGSERIRNEVLRRPRYTNEEWIGFSKAAKRHGIRMVPYVMIGLPEETLDDWNETIRVLRLSRPANLRLAVFYPYPGTDLHRKVFEEGAIDPNRIDGVPERRRAVLNLPGFSRRRIMVEFFLCHYKVFKDRWPLSTRLLWVARAFLSEYSGYRLKRLLQWLTRHTVLGRLVSGGPGF